MKVLVINGPNLDRLGMREPEVYGTTTLPELEKMVASWGTSRGIEVDCAQSNSESVIIESLHSTDADGVIINPGAFSHTSRALADAISSIDVPVVEVHISNVRKREPWRAISVVSEACAHSIYGRSLVGYRDALIHLSNRAAMPIETVRYGPHGDNFGDLRGDGEILVVIAHGGIWRHEFTRDTTESIAVDLARTGYTTWNLEYRRMGDGGGWPGSGHDVLTALDHVPRLNGDFEKVIVLGHSAGSYLAVWAAERTTTTIDLSVQLAGCFDLVAGAESGLIGAPDCETMLNMGAPAHVGPRHVATHLFHGSNDNISHVDQSSDLAERSSAVLNRTDSGHFEWLDPSKDEWRLVKSHILENT